jgi:hypothetical protein
MGPHDWGSIKKECVNFKGLEKKTLDFFSICIIVIAICVRFLMPLDKMVSF